jgi:hypothetical protein
MSVVFWNRVESLKHKNIYIFESKYKKTCYMWYRKFSDNCKELNFVLNKSIVIGNTGSLKTNSFIFENIDTESHSLHRRRSQCL